MTTSPVPAEAGSVESAGSACKISGYLRRGAGARLSPSVATADLVAFTCFAMNSVVFGGTSPTAVTWWPSTTVEKAEDDPTRAGPSAGAPAFRGSTNTETDATPSVNTRWATGSLEPGIDCADRVDMRKPGGSRIASQSAGAAVLAICGSARSQR